MNYLTKRICIIGLVLILHGPFLQSQLIAQIRTTVMPTAGFEKRIEKAVNDIRIIDTHEHLRTEEGVMNDSLYDFIYLFQQYINYDLIFAGMPKAVSGFLCVIYGYRAQPYGIRAKVSKDNGKTWSKAIILRNDART